MTSSREFCGPIRRGDFSRPSRFECGGSTRFGNKIPLQQYLEWSDVLKQRSGRAPNNCSHLSRATG